MNQEQIFKQSKISYILNKFQGKIWVRPCHVVLLEIRPAVFSRTFQRSTKTRIAASLFLKNKWMHYRKTIKYLLWNGLQFPWQHLPKIKDATQGHPKHTYLGVMALDLLLSKHVKDGSERWKEHVAWGITVWSIMQAEKQLGTKKVREGLGWAHAATAAPGKILVGALIDWF